MARPQKEGLDYFPHVRKKKPTVYAIWNDLFHEDVPEGFFYEVYTVMEKCPQHTFLLLTKRPKEMAYHLNEYEGRSWPLPNVWLGVTAENQQRADERIPILLQIPAAVRFVSIEPMLGPIKLDYLWLHPEYSSWYKDGVIKEKHPLAGVSKGLDWVICGGETGPGARPVHPDWVRSLRDQCQEAGVPFFFKQWGEWATVNEGGVHPGDICISEDGFFDTAGKDYVCFANESDGTQMRKVGKKAAGRLLDGRTWDEMPNDDRRG